jgi:DNA integrity scanning protein DisA with diadenylate cyclase activity
MRVLGFGAEIIATSPSLSTVKEALDPTATKTFNVPLERFGTRHRSAMRMCSSFDECIALVVSQDGPVKVLKRVGGDVVMWNDVTLGRLAI